VTPILHPRRSELPAYLKTGDQLVHRITKQLYAIDRVDYRRTEVVRPHDDGEHHIVGVTLIVKIGDTLYGEQHTGAPLAQIWDTYEEPVVHSVLYYKQQRFPASLSDLEELGCFEFYEGQREVISAMACVSGGMLAAETGAGKTLMGIALAYMLQPKCCLILVPQAVLKQWQQEFNRFWPGQTVLRLGASDIKDGRVPPGIWLSYHEEFLLNGGGLIRNVADDAFDMVIIDEAHLRQNPDTIMGDALWKLTPARRYALTATPIPNRLSDIYPICRWLRPDLTFKYNRQEEWVVTADGSRRALEPTVPLSPALFAMELKRIVAAVRKVDLRDDMPPMYLTVHKHAMEDDQLKTYSYYANDWAPEKGSGGQVARLRISHLRNACAAHAVGRIARNEALVLRIQMLAEQGKQVIVGCARVEQNTWLARRLRAAGIKFARIDSTVNSGDHAVHAAMFKNKLIPVMLIGVKCAYGHSFSECTTGILASPEWGWGTVNQFMGRFYRLDSKLPVSCEVHVCAPSVEEDMLYTLALKESAANAVLFGIDECENILAESVGLEEEADVLCVK